MNRVCILCYLIFVEVFLGVICYCYGGVRVVFGVGFGFGIGVGICFDIWFDIGVGIGIGIGVGI